MKETKQQPSKRISISDYQLSVDEILNDYRTALVSRHLSTIGRKEVHSGRAKFGIFGDGKEIAQIAYAKFFRNGDWRSGYYRDQSFMLAAGLLSPEEFFAQLYGSTNEFDNPSTAGRNFNNHFATPNINPDKSFKNLVETKNSASDISPTAGQMPRLLGLAYASKLFRQLPQHERFDKLSCNGNEVAFGMIGEASTSEGLFFETINAACVLQVPMAIAVWDDGFGISVPVELQTTKSNISKALEGFRKEDGTNGCLIYTAKGWNYEMLVNVFSEGISRCRDEHVPVVFHITEMTQPMGHSSSGSHERYKSAERLNFELEYDPILKMKEWIVASGIASSNHLSEIENEVVALVRDARQKAWKKYIDPYLDERNEFLNHFDKLPQTIGFNSVFLDEVASLRKNLYPSRSEIVSLGQQTLYRIAKLAITNTSEYEQFATWVRTLQEKCKALYNTKVYAESSIQFAFRSNFPRQHNFTEQKVTGREIINLAFDRIFESNPAMFTFGEDTGKLGDVNGGLKGLQDKFGSLRITDTGIREATIIGQGTGLALRGLRPIAEIQYLDYLVYALQTLTDDLASLHYRTNGTQVAPVIIRTRGHRLVGMWHSGSPLGMILGSLRGFYICTPRNMTQAAGFYNTLLELSSPAIVIEPLKSYDRYEALPENIAEYYTPLGVPEVLTEGTDLTVVAYGWCVNEALQAVEKLQEFNISVELIDVQTLIPFDVDQIIKKSIAKTHQVLFLDEDVPGGASAYMMQKVLEEQKAFYYLDSVARTHTAAEHRPAYDTDGDYFSKPNADNIFDAIYNMMHDYNPSKYPKI